MEIASVVFEHGFDESMLEQIQTLRCLRLDLAERMLLDVDKTSSELTARGLIDASEETIDADDLRIELQSRIATLRERLARPDLVYADEISLYVDLLEDDAAHDDLQ